MPRALWIVLFSAMTMLVACKTDKPAGTKAGEVAKVGEPPRPADRAMKPPELKPGDPADPEATGKNTELQNKGLAMMGRMADVFAANANDCEKLATEIRSMAASNKELLAQLNGAEMKQTSAERNAFEARNKAVKDAAIAKMEPAAKACSTNQSFLAALRDAQPK